MMAAFMAGQLPWVGSAAAAAGGGATPHRYWRINISANNGASFISIVEIELRSTSGGADQTTAADAVTHATASGFVSNEDPFKAFNDSGAMNPWSVTSIPAWIKYDFVSLGSKDIREYTIQARPDGFATTATPKDWTLEWSDDNSTWTTAHTVTGQTGWSSGEIRTFTLP